VSGDLRAHDLPLGGIGDGQVQLLISDLRLPDRRIDPGSLLVFTLRKRAKRKAASVACIQPNGAPGAIQVLGKRIRRGCAEVLLCGRAGGCEQDGEREDAGTIHIYPQGPYLTTLLQWVCKIKHPEAAMKRAAVNVVSHTGSLAFLEESSGLYRHLLPSYALLLFKALKATAQTSRAKE
jgi:hypothetical protein